jgi:hypothetical protein
MPDASWWDSQPGAPVRTPEELAARVRLLEGILLRVRDELAGAASWEELRAAARRSVAAADAGLGREPNQVA